MVSGGKPLWYLEMFTTFSIFVLTIFFSSTLGSWASGLYSILDDPEHTKLYTKVYIDYMKDFARTMRGATFYFNLGMGLLATISGAILGYLIYKEKVKHLYGLVWFGIVSSFTLVWMITSVIFYCDLSGIATLTKPSKTIEDKDQFDVAPLPTIRRWGHDNSGATVQGLVVFPTAAFLFLSFVAYRLYSKLQVFGNINPDNVVADENHPASWFERKTGAEGGTWQRESAVPAFVPIVEVIPQDYDGSNEPNDQPLLADDVKKQPTAETTIHRQGDVTGGWGSWLEDVFDYNTF
jgi:hypothetical protein